MRLTSLIIVSLLLSKAHLCVGGRSGAAEGGGLLGPRFRPQARTVCPRGSRLFIAVRCNDTSELLYWPPVRIGGYMQGLEGGPDVCSSASGWAAQNTCEDNDGFQEIMSYYTGCYPKDVDFWSSFAPELEIQSSAELNSKVVGYPLPPLNVANSDFEDPEIGITEWSATLLGSGDVVRQKNDNFPRCMSTRNCLAYNGTGYALISAGDSQDGLTPPNSLYRSDFRIPGVDTNVCQTATKFCFSFAMRFISKEVVQPPSETGNVDFFTVQIIVGEHVEMLYERTISSSDVEGFGDDTGRDALGDDGGWELVEIELPSVSLGEEPTFFTFRAMTTNVNDNLLSSVGYIDSLNIAPCVPVGTSLEVGKRRH